MAWILIIDTMKAYFQFPFGSGRPQHNLAGGFL